MRIFINTYFPKAIFIGIVLIVFLPLVVSPETVFPFVVGKSLWFRGIIYSILGFWIILISVNKKYLPEKSVLILFFSLFVLTQAISGLINSSPLNSFWGNWERMEGVVEYFHWLVFLLIAFSTLKTKGSWIALWKINTIAGFIVASLAFLEFFNITIPTFWGLDIFPVVVAPIDSYSAGRIESTIGNPTYVAAYLSLITFSSIALILREFHNSYSKSVIITFKSFDIKTKLYISIASIGSLLSFFAILNSGSRSSFIGIMSGIIFISIMTSLMYKHIRKYSAIPVLAMIILLPTFYLITNSIESQREDLRLEILTKYFPPDIFEKRPGWNAINAERESKEVTSRIPELTFIQEYFDLEKLFDSESDVLTQEKLLQYAVDNGKISKSEMDSRLCSDEILTYFWVTNRDSFRECTSIIRFISIFGSGISYPFKSGFNIGEREFGWNTALKGFADYPLLGVGPENFPILHYKYADYDMSDDKPHFDRAHNRLLHILATSGIIGFIFIMSLWIYMMVIIVKRIRIKNSESIFWMLFGSFLVSYIASSMFMFSVSSTYLQMMLLLAFLNRQQAGFKNMENFELLLEKENKEQKFVNDGLSLTVLIIIPIVSILLIRFYVAVPFQAAKVTPPLGSPQSLTEVQDNVNMFDPLANYGRQEIMYIIRRDYQQMIQMAEDANKFSEAYGSLTTLVNDEYIKAIASEPRHYNIHFATASVYLGLATYDANNLIKAQEILKTLEELSPNSVQTLEIKIRVALLRNDPVNAESLIKTWRKIMPEHYKEFWDENLGIIKGEIIPEWEITCRNDQYPPDKPIFEDSNVIYNEELENGVIVGIKQEADPLSFVLVAGNIVTLDYTGWLSNGCIFDSSYFPDVPTLTFKTGIGQAIPGFESALIGLSKGNIARIVIPPEMAYGAVGVKDLIPPNETIYFEVKILEVIVGE